MGGSLYCVFGNQMFDLLFHLFLLLLLRFQLLGLVLDLFISTFLNIMDCPSPLLAQVSKNLLLFILVRFQRFFKSQFKVLNFFL